MAMTPSGLSAVIKAALIAEYGNPPNAFGNTQLQQFSDAMGNAIVGYLQSNADVSQTGHSGPGLQNPAGQIGIVTGGVGAGGGTETTSPEGITGLGSLL